MEVTTRTGYKGVRGIFNSSRNYTYLVGHVRCEYAFIETNREPVYD